MATDTKQASDSTSTSTSENSAFAEVVERMKTVAESVDTSKMAKQLDIDESLIIDDLNMTELEKQQNAYTKTDLSNENTITKDADGNRLDDISSGKTEEIMDGVTITGNENGTVHCESDYLGEFDYDPEEFALGYKSLTEADGSESQLPVLTYIGDKVGMKTWFDDSSDDSFFIFSEGKSQLINIPEGLKVGDYMFANNEDLKYIPALPDSLTSMHCMFENCTETLRGAHNAYEEGIGWRYDFNDLFDIPDGIEDMSNAFKGCENLGMSIGEIPDTVVNMQNAFSGTEIGTDTTLVFSSGSYNIPEYGDDITPYLSSTYAKDALNDIADEDVKDYADSRDYVIDETGDVGEKYEDFVEEGLESGDLDSTKLQESQAATGLSYAEDIVTGKAKSEVELTSNGARSLNKYYNEETGEYAYDETGEIRSDKENQNTLWQRLAIDGVTGLGIGAIAGGLSGNKFVGLAAGIGGAALLDYTNVLPESFAPILKFTANVLPDGALKDKVTELYDKYKNSTIDSQKNYWTDDRLAEAHVDARLADSVSYFSYGNIMTTEALHEGLKSNGNAAAQYGAFWAVARQGESGEAVAGVTDTVRTSVSSMESQWASEYESSGMTEELQTEMSDYYNNLLSGMSAYSSGAESGISSTYVNDYTKKEIATEGLGMANRAAVSEILDSMYRMEETYGISLLTDEQLDAYSLDISGVGTLSEYKTNGFDGLKSEAELNLDSLISVDEIDYEAEDYECTDEYESRLSTSNQESKVAKVEETATNTKQASGASTSYAAQAEEAFGDMMNDSEEEETVALTR